MGVFNTVRGQLLYLKLSLNGLCYIYLSSFTTIQAKTGTISDCWPHNHQTIVFTPLYYTHWVVYETEEIDYLTGVQCKEEIQESVMWVRTPVPRDKQSALLELPCPGYDLTDNTTEICKIQKENGTDSIQDHEYISVQMDVLHG